MRITLTRVALLCAVLVCAQGLAGGLSDDDRAFFEALTGASARASAPQQVTPIKPRYVLIFSATWCGHCRSQDVAIEQLKRAGFGVRDHGAGGKARIFKVDVDRYPGFTAQHRVDDLPTAILMVGGVEVERYIGPLTRQGLLDFHRRQP